MGYRYHTVISIFLYVDNLRKSIMNSEFKSKYIENQSVGLAETEMDKIGILDKRLAGIVMELREKGPLPPLSYMQTIGSHDAQHFLSNMSMFSIEIIARCRASTASTILDLGCGCGRMALPISAYLGAEGRYIGIDVWEEGINWCKNNISSNYPNSEFYCLKSNNNYYFNDGTLRSNNEYSMKFIPEQTVDAAFAISLFTHLKRSDALSYLKELARILKPNGAVYITCFIIDHFFFEYRERTGNHVAVSEHLEDRECFYAYTHQDFFAGFSMGAWNAMLAEAGLWAVCYETGNWAEKPGARMYQDTFILMKRK